LGPKLADTQEHVSLSRFSVKYPQVTLCRSTKRKGKSGFGGGLLVGTVFVLRWVLIDRKTAQRGVFR
jgi:hypothetical protein